MSETSFVAAYMKVEYLLTLLTIIIAGSVAVVAYMQYKLAKDKFKLDLFEKHFAIYKEVESFLKNNTGNITTEDALNFYHKTKDAIFLFGDDIHLYLDEIFNKAIRLVQIGIENGSGPYLKERHELMEWFPKQLIGQSPPVIVIFSPYLKFKTWK